MMVPLDELEVQMLLASFQSVLAMDNSGRLKSTLDSSLCCNSSCLQSCKVHSGIGRCWCCILCAEQVFAVR